MTYGWATAKKSGVDFKGSGTALVHGDRPDEYFGIVVDTYVGIDSFYLERENFIFNEIKYEAGEYTIAGKPNQLYDGFVGSSYFTLSDDGDVLEDVYILDESKTNTLTIISVDTAANLVIGTFDVSYKIDPDRGKTNPNNPDKVRFSEGEFEVSFKY